MQKGISVLTFIAENEIQFVNFLNDGFKSGLFKLKLKKLQANKEVTKLRMLVYKQKDNANTYTLYTKTKEGKRAIGKYNKNENIIYTNNDKNFVSLRTKVSYKSELFKANVIHSPNQTNLVGKTNNEEVNETSSTKPIKKTTSEPVTKTNKDHIQAIKTLLGTELEAAKKVWVIKDTEEEIQVDNKLFDKEGSTFIGNKKNNVDLSCVRLIKFRGKLYLN